MIAYLANKEKFREDILSNRIEEIDNVARNLAFPINLCVGYSNLHGWRFNWPASRN
jgi:hypothetical protein